MMSGHINRRTATTNNGGSRCSFFFLYLYVFLFLAFYLLTVIYRGLETRCVSRVSFFWGNDRRGSRRRCLVRSVNPVIFVYSVCANWMPFVYYWDKVKYVCIQSAYLNKLKVSDFMRFHTYIWSWMTCRPGGSYICSRVFLPYMEL